MKEDRKTLSVIIPAYNESRAITEILERIIKVELPGRVRLEIWMIDLAKSADGSIVSFLFPRTHITLFY